MGRRVANAEVSADPVPQTRREARALREAAEVHRATAARQAKAVANETRQTATVRPARPVPLRAPAGVRPQPDGVRTRGTGRTGSATRRPFITAAAGAALLLIPGVMFAMPANATPNTLSSSTLSAMAADAHARQHAVAQILSVAADATGPTATQADYIGHMIAGVAVTAPGVDPSGVALAISDALQVAGDRQNIVETALSYLGTPYVLGGASRSGIDCSGLVMEAYAAVGIHLFHGVIAQDADGVVISAAQAQPGDLVVFDSDEHVAIYLGGGLLIAAPEEGRDVEIEKLATWSGIPYHFTRILPATAG